MFKAGLLIVPTPPFNLRPTMTLCPVAIVVGCQKCPVFKVCPLKSVIGDAPKPEAPKAKPAARKTAAPRKTVKKTKK
jgi:hypothetical protein